MPDQEVLLVLPVLAAAEVGEVEGQALAVGELVPYLPRKVDDQRLDEQEERDPLVVRDLPPRTLPLDELAEVWVDYILADLKDKALVTAGAGQRGLDAAGRCWGCLKVLDPVRTC